MRKILLYGFEDLPSVLAVKAAAGPFLAEVETVWKENYRKPIGVLAGLKKDTGASSGFSGALGGRMMVFCGLDEQVDALLPALRQAGIGPECYKAVLTQYNQEWDGLHLFSELEQERRTIQAQQGGAKE